MDIKLLADNYPFSIYMIDPIKRGTADILYRSDTSLIFYDTQSRAVMAYTVDDAEALEFAKSLKSCSLMCTNSRAMIDNISTRFKISMDMICRQAVYLGGRISYEPRLSIVRASEDEEKIVSRYYSVISAEDLERVRKLGNLFCGYKEGVFVGFIGQHLEGSIGMLHVLPQFRRMGYAEEMELFMINRITGEGRIPFAHILYDNIPSLSLQKKLGMKISDELIYWGHFNG